MRNPIFRYGPLFTFGGLLLDLVPWGEPQGGIIGPLTDGWAIENTCSSYPENNWKIGSAACFASFLGVPSPYNDFANAPVNVPNPGGVNIRRFTTYYLDEYPPGRGVAGGLAGIKVRTYRQTPKNSNPAPFGKKPINPYDRPRPNIPWPAVDPFDQPILQPLPPAFPIPYRVIPDRRPNPSRSPDEQPGGSEPGKPPSHWPSRVHVPKGSTQPSYDIIIRPRTPPGSPPNTPTPPPVPSVETPGPGFHVRKPERRERKVIMGIDGASRLGKLLGSATEINDFVNAAWVALPWSIRKEHPRASFYEKLITLLQNLDRLAPGTLVTNLISETLEDKAFGKFSKIGARAAREAYKNGFVSPRPELGPADQPVGPRNAKGGAGDLKRDPYVEALDKWLDRHVYRPALGL